MLDSQASRFWQAAVFSGLMDVEALSACWNAIPPAKRNAPEHIDRRLARQAVQSNSLTLWQAQQLLAGRTSGFKVDRYLLLDLIGQGGMGRVYLARDTRLNRRVALKILAPERVNNPRAVARFQREARVGAQLQHENLVRIYDFGEANARFYLVMEFIQGKTIGHLISEQGPMPMATAARLVRQVAMGLAHAHIKGLIHRDVNPYNIMVTDDGTAKLADLGLAIDLTEGDRVTREGATVGTFDYVAPEQARHSHAADIRSDIYSLGCTLYHMLTGQVPFPSPSLPEKLFAHQALEPTPVEQLAPGLDEGFVEIVRKMMRKSPDERYATPTQVIQAMEPYLDEAAGYAPRPERARPSTATAVVASPQPDRAREPSSATSTPTSDSRPSEDAAPVALPMAAVELAAVGLSPPAVPVGDRSPNPDGARGPGPSSGGDLDDPSVPLLTPMEEPPEADTNGSLFVDLGPVPPLSERLARSRPRAPTATPPRPAPRPSRRAPGSFASTSTTAEGSVWWPPVGVLWGLVLVAVVATVLAVILGLAGGLRWFRQTPPEIAGKTLPRQSAREDVSPIVVHSYDPDADDDEKRPPPGDLYQALKQSIGRGYVELSNREPLLLEAGKLDDLKGGQGRIEIRAAPGVVPILEIRMEPGKHFLTTGSSISLRLTGLDIRVDYKDAGGAAGVAPVIQAAGPVRLDRCAFRVVDGARPEGCCAVSLEGKELTIDRCWFQGFDKAIRIHAYHGTFAIRQTMVVTGSPVGPMPSPTPDWYGWGVEVRLEQGEGRRLLELEDCTFEGAGLLDLVPTTVPLPLEVVVRRCAVRSRAILAFPQELQAAQLHWQGQGNHLEILEKGWIVLSSRMGTPALSTSVIDPETWSKVVGEKGAIQARVNYRTTPSSRRSAEPRDFAVDVPDAPGTKVGADPEQVGPWGR